jgi:hypothetical protein
LRHILAARSWCVIDPAVDHHHDDGTAAGRKVPGGGGMDVGARGATALPGILQRLQLPLGKVGIIRGGLKMADKVRSGIYDIGALAVAGQCLLHRHANGSWT